MQRLADAIGADIARQLYDGAEVIVARDGKQLLHSALGCAHRQSGRELRKADIFAVFSISKPITACLALQRVERGLVRLDTPVAEIIPEFAARGKAGITLAHLLCHMAGMPATNPNLALEDQGDLEQVVASVCGEALVSVLGERVSYSPIMAHAVIGELVRRLDGGRARLGDILARDIFAPLGMRDSALGMRGDLAARAVPVIVRDRRPGMFDADSAEALGQLVFDVSVDAEIPSGGVVSTAGDIFRFAEALRLGGSLDGGRILSPATIALATHIHSGDKTNNLYDFARGMRDWPEFPANLGFGFFVRGGGHHPTYFGMSASPATFGAMGAGSTLFWVDPERGITFVCLTCGLMEETRSCDRFMRLSDIAIAAALS
ncbi:MAG: serine hydrolase domain-containing protein [Alphaproteobacteria bacterium]|nr:serine hydrolase domain-containing protein [Alphaproteobacteria bacterium]